MTGHILVRIEAIDSVTGESQTSEEEFDRDHLMADKKKWTPSGMWVSMRGWASDLASNLVKQVLDANGEQPQEPE